MNQSRHQHLPATVAKVVSVIAGTLAATATYHSNNKHHSIFHVFLPKGEVWDEYEACSLAWISVDMLCRVLSVLQQYQKTQPNLP